MPLDDRTRVQRLRAEPRTDRSLGERMHRFCAALQTRLGGALARLDGAARFSREEWERPGRGGGVAQGIEGGAVFVAGDVTVFAVFGERPERAAGGRGGGAAPFFATGLSLVLHAVSPRVPAVRARLRYVRFGEDPFRPADEWFDGGAYLVSVSSLREDAEPFLRVWKAVCDRHPEVADYERFVRREEGLSVLPRRGPRGAPRGAVGLVFDPLRGDPEIAFHFVREAGRAFLSSYVPLVERP